LSLLVLRCPVFDRARGRHRGPPRRWVLHGRWQYV